MTRSTDAMVMTTTATGCEWSSPGAAGAPEAGLEGSAEPREAGTGPRPDAPSTGSSCQVGELGLMHGGGWDRQLSRWTAGMFHFHEDVSLCMQQLAL